MKATITKVTFKEEKQTKYGMQYTFVVEYDGKKAYYNSKSKDQKKFVEGEEAEFNEQEMTSTKGNKYLIIRPEYKGGKSEYGRQLKRIQSQYSSFGVSYVKDLIIAGVIDIKQWESASEKIISFMYEQDKKYEDK